MSSDKYCKIHWIPTTAVRINFACIFGNKLSTNDLDLTRCVWAGFSFSVQRLFVPTIANPGAIGYTCACFFAPGWRKGRERRNGRNSIVFPYLRQLPVDQEKKRTACLHAHVFGHVSIKPAKVVFKIVGHQTWDECLELRIFHVFFVAGGVAIASAATDQQETCPMDINELPVPAEVHMTTSPETSSDSKREVYQRLRKKTPPEDARVPAPQALPSQEKPSTSDKPESTEELEEAGEGLASSGQWMQVKTCMGKYHWCIPTACTWRYNIYTIYCNESMSMFSLLGKAFGALCHKEWPIGTETSEVREPWQGSGKGSGKGSG